MMRRREARSVFGLLHRELGAGRHAAVATVVALRGSGFRRPGARMLITRDGRRLAGALSGGCLEADVQLHAVRAMTDGEPLLLRYDTSAEEGTGIATGCRGQLKVLVQPYTPAGVAPVAALCVALAGRAPVTIVAEGAGTRFADTLAAAPRLFVCGNGEDATAVADLACATGMDALLLGRRGPLGDEPAADDFALIMTHDFAADRAWLERLLPTPVRYIGLMGPRQRVARLRAVVRHDPRIYGPVGLDIGAEGAEQVAVSIVAELLAVRSARSPRHLRERVAPLHHAMEPIPVGSLQLPSAQP